MSKEPFKALLGKSLGTFRIGGHYHTSKAPSTANSSSSNLKFNPNEADESVLRNHDENIMSITESELDTTSKSFGTGTIR